MDGSGAEGPLGVAGNITAGKKGHPSLPVSRVASDHLVQKPRRMRSIPLFDEPEFSVGGEHRRR